MSEITIPLQQYYLLDIYGVNDRMLNLIRSFNPKLKLIARGDELRVLGEKTEAESFVEKFNLLLISYDKFGRITESDIMSVMGNGEATQHIQDSASGDVLLHGRNGKLIKARTVNQHKMVELSDKNDLLFAIGPAGTGKTYTAVALAVRALKNKEVQRIILTRPAVEAGENLGFLPGD
ncbi:MAG TPA: PhoH family protein, partial [Bacteroidales bacterium]|nr:PhoH family protein [Bacteroidales bacterium]